MEKSIIETFERNGIFEKYNCPHIYEEHIEITFEQLKSRLKFENKGNDKNYDVCSKFNSKKIVITVIKHMLKQHETFLKEWWDYSSNGNRVTITSKFSSEIGEGYVRKTNLKKRPYPMYNCIIVLQKDNMLDWKLISAYPVPNERTWAKINMDRQEEYTKRKKHS